MNIKAIIKGGSRINNENIYRLLVKILSLEQENVVTCQVDGNSKIFADMLLKWEVHAENGDEEIGVAMVETREPPMRVIGYGGEKLP
eukprot:snap_masked-scaffold_28-processed-gene-2.26-mRNA-1 protein AED:1.00 eAED:1.00 QI:0/-1/0/0/-1/1/1/0/86